MNTTMQEDAVTGSHSVSARDGDSQVYGSFHLGSHELALPARILRDVVPPPERFTPQPLAPEYMAGIMTLRGMTIPVIDLRTMLDIPDPRPEREDMRIAVVEYGAYNIGMLFDDTAEVFRTSSHNSKFCDYSVASRGGIVRGAFRFEQGQRLIQLLDTSAIIEFEGAPLLRDINANATRESARPQSRGPRYQSIFFGVKGARLGINIGSISEIIQLHEMDTSLKVGAILPGTIRLREKTMALIDLASALGLEDAGQDTEATQQHVIVVDDTQQLTGLIVDDIFDIRKYYGDEIGSFPVFADSLPEIFLGAVGDGHGEEVLQLDVRKLMDMEAIQHAIGRGGDFISDGEGCDGTDDGAQTIERQTYLTFRVERLFGVPILDVAEVVDYPDQLLRPPLLEACIDGILDLRGELIRVYSARRLYGIDEEGIQSQQIIVFERDGERFGLAIDTVESIATVQSNLGRPLPDTNQNRSSVINQDVREAICYSDKDSGKMRDILALDPDAIANRIRWLSSAEGGQQVTALHAVQ